jgi:hypothetical protein
MNRPPDLGQGRKSPSTVGLSTLSQPSRRGNHEDVRVPSCQDQESTMEPTVPHRRRAIVVGVDGSTSSIRALELAAHFIPLAGDVPTAVDPARNHRGGASA